MQRLTIHGLALDDVVAVISGEEELEVRFGVLNASDFIFVIDVVTIGISISIISLREGRVYPKPSRVVG